MLIRIASCRLLLLALAAGAAQAAPSTVTVLDANVGTSDLPVTLSFPALRTGDLGYDIAAAYRDASDPWILSGTTHFTTLTQDTASSVLPVLIPPHTANDADANVYLSIDQAVGLGPMPSFSAPDSVAVGEAPRAIAVGDINRDGIADLAVAHGGSVSVLLGTTLPGAAPSFSGTQDFALGLDLAALRLTDVNGDGKLDLVSTDAGDGSVVVRMGTTATGSAAVNFAAPSTFAAGALPDALAIADMDGDGRPDAIVADRQGQGFSVLLNTTTPGATTPSFLAAQAFDLGGEPGSLVVVDLDLDHGAHRYVAATVPQASAIVIRKLASAPGQTTLSFAAAESVAVAGSPGNLVAMDFDNDGLVDFAAPVGAANSIAVLFNRGTDANGSHLFETGAVAVGPGPGALAAADLNGDGKPELLSGHAADASVSVVRNACTPTSFWSPLQRLAGAGDSTAVVVADLNGDGRDEVLALNREAGAVAVFVNTTPESAALPAFQREHSWSTLADPTRVRVADVDMDGRADLIAVMPSAQVFEVRLSTGRRRSRQPSFDLSYFAGTSPSSADIAVIDVNGDRRADFVVVSPDSGISVFLNETDAPDGFNVGTRYDFALDGFPDRVAVADLDGDGRPDLVATGGNRDVRVLRNLTVPGAAVPSFDTAQVFTLGNAFGVLESVEASDINGDGRTDLVVAGGGLGLMVNTTAAGAASMSFALPASPIADVQGPVTAIADFNADGRPDFVAARANPPGDVHVALNTTPPGALVGSTAAAFALPTQSSMTAAAADIDGDGRPDLVVGEGAPGRIGILRNTTAAGAQTPSFAAEQFFGTGGTGGEGLALGDLNQDGRADVVVSQHGDSALVTLMDTRLDVDLTGLAATGTLVHDFLFAGRFE